VLDNIESFANQLFQAADADQTLSYRDATSGHDRIAVFAGSKLRGALFLAPAPVAVSRTSLADELNTEFIDPRARFRIIAGKPGAAQPDKGAIVCSCYSIGANEINAVIRSGQCCSVAAVGDVLKAGTNCGSCRAEIGSMIQAHQPIAAE
jgi:assimilatory nitrate reductase catalytic subunit